MNVNTVKTFEIETEAAMATTAGEMAVGAERDAADPSVIGFEVTEYLGTGDPFFGGSADDRPLGKSGAFLYGSYRIGDIARFDTRLEAELAAVGAPKRPGSRIGVSAVRDFSQVAS